MSDVCTGVFVKRGVVPEDVVALSVFTFACFGWFVLQGVVVSTFIECLPESTTKHAKHRNSTELSKHIWTLKDNNIEHLISWRILASHSPYNNSSKRCNLCLKEKLLIICRPELSTLNKRNELVSSCRHRNKTLLRNN